MMLIEHRKASYAKTLILVKLHDTISVVADFNEGPQEESRQFTKITPMTTDSSAKSLFYRIHVDRFFPLNRPLHKSLTAGFRRAFLLNKVRSPKTT